MPTRREPVLPAVDQEMSDLAPVSLWLARSRSCCRMPATAEAKRRFYAAGSNSRKRRVGTGRAAMTF